MIQRKRSRLSLAEKQDIWRRWKCGQSMHAIGRAYGRPHPTIRKLLLPSGGIPPVARRRSLLALTLAEREDISRGIASGSSIREIAGHLHRAASTVSREIIRHGGRPAYRAHDADQQAWGAALRPKKCRLAGNRKLRDSVGSKLILDWSPEQISGWRKTRYPNNESMRVSHETIYRSLFIPARGVLKKELLEHLRSKRACAARDTPANMDTPAGRSSMLSPSAKDLRKRKTERFLVIGKAICWPVERTAILRR